MPLLYKEGSFKVFIVMLTTFVVVQLIILLFPFLPTIDIDIENLKHIYGEKEHLTNGEKEHLTSGEKEHLTGFGELVIKQVIQHTTFSSIVMLIIVFIYLLVDALLDKPATNQNEKSDDVENSKRSDFAGVLTRLLISSLAASAIPAGISLILCALYDISFIKYMSGVEIYIAFAGISLVTSMYFSVDESQKLIKGGVISDMEDFKVKKER
jgi:hypothetical protein